MRLVSEPLEEVEGGICSSEADRIGLVWTKNDLFTLRQRSKGYIGHTDIIERTSGSAFTLRWKYLDTTSVIER